MKKYVAGFLFSEKKDQVALVEKQKPEWQKGKLNAIGGKVEEGEDPLNAMAREFQEETGLNIQNWKLFTQLLGPDYIVYFYVSFNDLVYQVKTQEEEKISTYPVEEGGLRAPDGEGEYPIIPNLRWLIPLAADEDIQMAIINSNV